MREYAQSQQDSAKDKQNQLEDKALTALRIGTRGSKLALTQTAMVKSKLEALYPNLAVSQVVITTKGDAIQQVALDKIGDKGLFVKEIEQALVAGEIDLAVHSMKDMPSEVTEGLCFAPSIGRADASDLLVVADRLLEPLRAEGRDLKAMDAKEVVLALPKGARIGTGAKRRAYQIQGLRRDLEIAGIRGNVDTRLHKLFDGHYDAILLAKAGLDRLNLTQGLTGAQAFVFAPTDLLPAPAQGILGLQTRQGDKAVLDLLKPLVDLNSHYACLAERSFLKTLGAGCHMPVGAYATFDASGGLRLDGLIGDVGGEVLVSGQVYAAHVDETSALGLGLRLADQLLQALRVARNQTVAGKHLSRVYLVGAGPGDTQLMTLKGKALLEGCDAVVYDRLANPKFLAWVPKEAQRIYVGKASGDHAMTQEDINASLVRLGTTHNCVVRLKGGDPYVFGRGGEEGEALYAAGIPFEVVPGITSSIGGIAYAGIPITHRDHAASFHVITGHLKGDGNRSDDNKSVDNRSDDKAGPGQGLDFHRIASYEGTLVFLMGLSALETITGGLVAAGMAKDTPAALVASASHPHQQKLVGTLDTLAGLQATAQLKSPAIIVVGSVVGVHDTLDWFSRRPLAGKRYAVTRARDQASSLVDQLEALGATVVEFPTIRIEPRGDEALVAAIHKLEDYTYICFTSQNGVERFFDGLGRVGKDSRALAGIRLVAVGSATASALGTYGLKADLVPPTYDSESVAALLKEHIKPSDRILLPRAAGADQRLPEALRSLCSVESLRTYEAVPAPLDAGQQKSLFEPPLDGITFTSGSTVRFFFEQLGADAAGALLARTKSYVIGPATEGALVALGADPLKLVRARTATVADLVAAILNEEGNHD